MRVAFFSPLPPAKSGIADYAEALLAPLRRLVDVTVFDRAPESYDPARFDVALYQLGNNGWHGFAYEHALRYPGVTVLHEANLHHLITDLTIKRGDWDGYVEACATDGGAPARAHAELARALRAGPDYDGVPMLRRILHSSRGAIAHSHFVCASMRETGYTGPAAVIPHGAWLDEPRYWEFRSKLGIPEGTPLVGSFGFLKPYKRLAESLRAFQRVLKGRPDARLILGGETHPEFDIAALIRRLGLSASVRLLGHLDIDEFNGSIGACDVILNLRYPTVGETSGTLLRAMGMGRAVIVSDIGAFAELPDQCVLKVPVGPGEEDTLFEYLTLLVNRPDLAQALGQQSRQYLAEQCSWPHVAELYARFLRSVVSGEPYAVPVAEPAAEPAPEASAALAAATPEPTRSPLLDELRRWAPPGPEAKQYLETHIARLARTLELTPPGGPGRHVLEMGAYFQITPLLRATLGYEHVEGCYYGPLGKVEHKTVHSADGREFSCAVRLFDAERDRFPYEDGRFDTVLCCELLEHLAFDPMHLMSEINRILKDGGHLVLTTPNATSLRAIDAILKGYHPAFFASYIVPNEKGEIEPRHAREYAPMELRWLAENSGFTVTALDSGEFGLEHHPEYRWIHQLLERYRMPGELRGNGLYLVARKTGPVGERYPGWLYAHGA